MEIKTQKRKALHDHHEAVEKARKKVPSDVCIFGLAEIFSLVADPTKLKILISLLDGELCVCAIADLLNVSESVVSHQLRLLKSLRVVTFNKVGRTVYYRLTDHQLTHQILQIATNYCATHRI